MRTAAAAALLAMSLAACAGADDPRAQDDQDLAQTPISARVPTTTPSGSGPATAEPSPSASPAPSSAGPRSPAPSPSRSATFPPQSPAVHGGTATAVYLAVAYDAQDPELERVEAQARQVGYDEVGGGDVGCDRGAREALRLDPERAYYTAALYFADRAAAQQFVDAYEPGVVGIADVTTYCLD